MYSKTPKNQENNVYLSNTLLPQNNEVKDLGITFQNNLKFNKHIDNIIFKAKRKIRFLKFKCKRFKNIQLLKIMYNSIIKSNLMYGSIIWNPTQKGKIEELEKVQHLFLRFLSYKTNAPMK